MLFKNDIFLLDGQRHRLLHVEPSKNKAWVLCLDDPTAWPEAFPWSNIVSLEPGTGNPGAAGPQPSGVELKPTPAMLRARDNALRSLGNLPNQTPAIFYLHERARLVRQQSQAVQVSITSIYKYLRRYWTGGQIPAALLGSFNLCGRRERGNTAGRGSPPQFDHSTFQVTERDRENFAHFIEEHYLCSEKVSMQKAFEKMLRERYNFVDGNGKARLSLAGERPSRRQFTYYLKKHYSLEERLRRRKGKDFELNDRAKLGTVLADCLGVGHYYEADATIADVYLVAAKDIRTIVGKPTIYLIIDRKSRLIVGWYVGLENASWVCAMLAFLSISQDKAQMCARYDVPYDPLDWPAHQVFPKEVLADRSELYTKDSNNLCNEIGVTVTNVSSGRGDWKPVIECGFKQTRTILEDETPGFDPPENAKRRQGKHYEKDACLTLDQFCGIILRAIIAHNRKPLGTYELSLKELTDGVLPYPIALWNHNIVERAGLLPRFHEEHIRMALLSKAEASVTEHGIEFAGCFYTCPEAIERGWFVVARKSRFKVEVSFDRRLVDTIFVQRMERREAPIRCVLTARSMKYEGLSFAEVAAFEKLRKSLDPVIEQERLQANADFHRGNQATIDAAKTALKKAGKGKARSARKADTKAARVDERRAERQESAGAVPLTSSPTGKVVPLHAGRAVQNDTEQARLCNHTEPPTMAEILKRAREKMLNG